MATCTMTSTMRQAAKTSNLKSRGNSKYLPSCNAKGLSSHASLLDMMRATGPQILGVQEPVQPMQARRPRSSELKKVGRSDQESSVISLPSTCQGGSSVASTEATSKPIRIVPKASLYDGADDENDDFDSSPAELERFYDQATWRMYVLIQSARLANEHHKQHHHAVPYRGRVPTTSK